MKQLRYRLEFLVAWLGLRLVQALPLGAGQALGRSLGRLAFRLGVARTTTMTNLSLRFEQNDDRQRHALALAAYASFGQTMLEIMQMGKLTPADLSAMFQFEGLEILDALRAQGRGAVCLSGHYGNWEWMAAALVARGYPVTLLIGTQSNPWTDALFNSLRQRHGIQMIRAHAIRDALKALKQGRMLAFVGDQDGDKWGTFAPFFGAEASTHSFGELLARKAGVAMLFGVAERLSDRHVRVEVKVVPEAPEGLQEAQATAFRLKAYNALLEAAIRRHPEQWLWMHRRWQSIPLHRLSGEDRRLAEAGEIIFDMELQQWRRTSTKEPIVIEGWR